MTPNAVRQLAAARVLTAIYPAGTGKGKKIYLNPDEVDAYAAGGVEGAVMYRKKQAKKKK